MRVNIVIKNLPKSRVFEAGAFDTFAAAASYDENACRMLQFAP
jgi:hypothetical protein